MNVFILAHDSMPTSGWGRITSETLREFDALNIDYAVALEDLSGYDRSSVRLLPATSFRNMLKNCLVVRRAARPYRIVHAFDVWPYGVYAYCAVLGTKKRLFFSGIGTYSVEPLYSRMKRIAIVPALRRARRIFAMSAYTLREMQKRVDLGHRGVIVHMGATALPRVSEEAIRQVRDKYHVEGTPVVISVGAIKDRKGQWDTVRAIELLREKYPEILYLIVGSSASRYAQDLTQYIADHELTKNVRMITDARSDTALAALYSLSTIFALNSTNDDEAHHFEGFGLVFLEAYQFGLPAVGSRNCGIEDAIDDGRTGYLSNQRDPRDIADKIERIIQMGKESYAEELQAFRSRFSWSTMAKAYAHAYETV